MNYQKIYSEISKAWDDDILPVLADYIKIPNKSPVFDTQWKEHGYMDQAMKLIADWCRKQPIKGMSLEILELPNHTPLLFIEIPGDIENTVVLYGHMDKQPEMTGWDPDLGPWKPVFKGDKLYGRGGADDGYSVFASLTAIAALQRHHIPHARCVLIIEGCEESGSYDLPHYLEKLKNRVGSPNFVVCLDSGCGNYDQLWCTTSLRGNVGGKLHINVLHEGMHSGLASGIVPSPFMILRQLLDRIEDSENSQIRLKELYVDIPPAQVAQIKETARTLGHSGVMDIFSFLPGVQPVSTQLEDLLLNNTWRPQLSVIGLSGLPSTENAGNVTIPSLSVTLSVRLPPECDPERAEEALKKTLEENPPFQAQVTFTPDTASIGWNAPEQDEWLTNAANTASEAFFHKPTAYVGVGGGIPFMGMLEKMYPKAQFLVTGVLGPKSNAHGPNEFLHIPTVKKLTACISSILAAHCEHFSR